MAVVPRGLKLDLDVAFGTLYIDHRAIPNGILHFLSVHPLLRTLEIQGMPFIFNPGIPVGGGQNNPGIPVGGSQNNPGIPVGGGQNNPGIPVGGGQNKKNLHGNSGGRG